MKKRASSLPKSEPPQNYTRLNLALNETKPIQVMVYSYSERTTRPLCDMHYELELGIVLRGRIRRLYPEHRLELETGQVWFCGMWEPHGFEVLEVPCEVVVLVIWPPLLANLFFPEASKISWMAPFTLPVEKRPSIPFRTRQLFLNLARRMAATAGGDFPFKNFRLRLLLLDLLSQLLADLPVSISKPSASPSETYHQISPALNLALRAHALITNEEAAKLCGMSRDQFIRRFQQLMGTSFAQFALRQRISGAANELVQTNQPIKAIVQQWGFTDPSHLHRLFVCHYGCSPPRYRERIRSLSPAR